ncbi:hypothetical protein BOTU111921_00135 [Bordetella tumbae]|uniref:hypothetical protein n=1 Tax=Bordetella tumbae TaxID=1649139 RepID=UPI0039EE1AD2
MGFRIKMNPHNTLFNIAFYHLRTAEDKVQDDTPDGLTLDCVSCIVFTAFAVEALLNFVAKETDYKENPGDKFPRRLKSLCESVGMEYDAGRQPVQSIQRLQAIRNALAHGKPYHSVSEASSKAELDAAMKYGWRSDCTPEAARRLFDNAKAFKKQLLDCSKIPPGQELDCAIGGWAEVQRPTAP